MNINAAAFAASNTEAAAGDTDLAPKNAFDFFDVSDLPEELQKGLKPAVSDAAAEWAEVVRKGKEHGYDSLSINQIMAAGTRLGLDIPAAATVRGYLNRAVDSGLLDKPTRQTYAVAGTAKRRTKACDDGLTDALVSTLAAAAIPEVEADPLAGL